MISVESEIIIFYMNLFYVMHPHQVFYLFDN